MRVSTFLTNRIKNRLSFFHFHIYGNAKKKVGFENIKMENNCFVNIVENSKSYICEN